MWQTWLIRVAQAAGAVQAGVVQTGPRGAGGRAAGGVRGTSCGFRRMICSVLLCLCRRTPRGSRSLLKGCNYAKKHPCDNAKKTPCNIIKEGGIFAQR